MTFDTRPLPAMGSLGDDGRATEPLLLRPRAEGEFDYRYHLDKSFDLRGSRLPYARNPGFVGRADTLSQLAERLNTDKALVILAGPTGIGKTQIAVEFAYRCAAQFPGGIFWLRCSHRDLIPSEVAACGSDGRATAPNYETLSQAEKIGLVVSAWHKPTPRLLILDDVDDREIVAEWKPETGGCRVLILTTHLEWTGPLQSRVMTLPPLDPGSSLQLLAGNDPARLHAFATDRAADTVIDLLEHLPIALRCAGAYIAGDSLSPASYLGELCARIALAEDPDPTPDDDTNPIAAIALGYVKLKSHAGASANGKSSWPGDVLGLPLHLFQLLAHCAPQIPVPRKFLLRAAHIEQESFLTESLLRLSELGLVLLAVDPLQANEHCPIIQRLPQNFARTRAPTADADLIALQEAMADVVDGLLTTGDKNSVTPFLPHMKTLAEMSTGAGAQLSGRLFHTLGRYFDAAADPEAALTAFQRARAIDERTFGPEHPSVGRHLNNIGRMHRLMGNMQSARAAFEQALAIEEKGSNPDNPDLAEAISNLGHVYRSLGELKPAHAAFERALAIYKKVNGPNHLSVGREIYNLAQVYKQAGDLPVARTAFEHVRSIYSTTLGLEHPEMADLANNLGLIYKTLNDLPAARAAFEHALAVDEKVYGPEHPNTARDIQNLSIILQELGDLPAICAIFKRALVLDEQAFGPEHPNVAARANTLGALLQELGDLPGARGALERALKIDEKTFGANHPNVAKDYNNLGVVCREMGDLPAARAAFEHALAIDTKAFGPAHPNVARDNNNLGAVLQEMGDLPAACASLELALTIDEKAFG
ncbi:MAG TPA: tetratricopeptide repeat protein, partial [Anaerolineales bacterium]|nr:tetratricopeptide repeat protein [Anaerolineales bacterium]